MRPYLVQRLENPFPTKSETLEHAGNVPTSLITTLCKKPDAPLNEEERTWFNKTWKLDYMGSAEFEFGAFGRSIRETTRLACAGKIDVIETMEFTGTPYAAYLHKTVMPEELLELTKVRLYGWCAEGTSVEELRSFVLNQLNDPTSRENRLKERTDMQAWMFGSVDFKGKLLNRIQQVVAWYDLDNHWLLTTNRPLLRLYLTSIGI